jgi:hypothetical protein
MARTVGLAIKPLRLIPMPICSLSLATRTAASSQWPPRSKKLSSTPTLPTLSTCANRSHSSRSLVVAGDAVACRARRKID